MSDAPIKECDYCGEEGVMPTFMDGETICAECTRVLPLSSRKCRIKIASLRSQILSLTKKEVGKLDSNDFKKKIVHSEMVKALCKKGEDIIAELTPKKAHVWHMATGIVGEAGELSEAVKKFVIYGKDLDRENAKEELGDLEFYMAGIRQGLGITRQETLEHNVEKLSKRYEGLKYSNDAANARADKAEEE